METQYSWKKSKTDGLLQTSILQSENINEDVISLNIRNSHDLSLPPVKYKHVSSFMVWGHYKLSNYRGSKALKSKRAKCFPLNFQWFSKGLILDI